MTTEHGKSIEAWEDPPESPPKYDWDDIAQKLKRRPNQWAKIFDRDRTSVTVALRNGSIKALQPQMGFVVRTSHGTRETPRMCTLHMKYDPELDMTREDTK